MFNHSNLYRGVGLQLLSFALASFTLFGAGCSDKEATSTQKATTAQAPAPQTSEPEPIVPAEAPEPAAEPQAADTPADTQAATVDGQKIYQASCQACHVAGVAGAPKLGDKEAWAPRLAKGNDALFSSVKNGLKAMPPKGACMSCSEDELRAALQYMIEQSS